MQRSLRKCWLGLCLLPALVSCPSWAVPTLGSLDIQFWAGNNMSEWTPTIVNTSGGLGLNNYTNTYNGTTFAWYNCTLNSDPFISASVDVINNTATVQNYTLIFTLPVSPAVLGGSLIGGSTQGGLTDANFDGTGTLSTQPGQPLYFGQIDGVNILSLFPDLTSISVPFAGGSTNISTSAGLPGPTIPGPNALTSIGIKEEFSLTPGDRATFTSFFVVNPANVPEPTSLSLLGVAALLAFRRRR